MAFWHSQRLKQRIVPQHGQLSGNDQCTMGPRRPESAPRTYLFQSVLSAIQRSLTTVGTNSKGLEAAKATKSEKKLTIALAGYLERSQVLSKRNTEAFEELYKTQVEYN